MPGPTRRTSFTRHASVRSAVSLLALLVTGPASAGPDDPSPPNHEFPCAIKVAPAPAALAAHEVEIILRDASNNPIPFKKVIIDFSACGSDVRVALAQHSGTATDCPSQSVSQFTDADGRAVFRIIGGGTGAAAFTSGACARISYDAVSFGNFQVSTFDYDGVHGLTSADLSMFLQDFFSCPVPPTYCTRSDYNFVEGNCGSQEITATDLSRWLDVFFVGATYEVPLCP